MVNFSSLFIVFKDLENRKLSSFLTFFAISLGILSIFVIFLISIGFTNSIQAEFEKVGTNLIIISPLGGGVSDFSKKGLTDRDLKLVENRPFIESASAYYIRNAQIEFDNQFRPNLVMGSILTKKNFEIFNLEIDKGRFAKENEKYAMIIGPDAATDLFDKDIRVNSNVYISGVKFKVVGILKSVGNPQDDKNIYVNINTIRDIYGDLDMVSQIYARVVKTYDVDLAANNTKIYLENRHGKDSIDVKTFKQMISSLTDVLDIVKFTLAGIAFISLLVGAIGIINTIFVIISEKTKQIGILKALGARNKDILFIYIFQAGLYGLLGGILGMIFGIFLSFGFEAWAQKAGFTFLKIGVDWGLVLSLLVFSFFIGVLSGFIPAYKASHLKIVDTFRK